MDRSRERTILVVDDQQYVLSLAARMVRAFGYRAVTADGPATALDWVRHERIDCVLTDLLMPGMSGPELVKRIGETRDCVPAVYMSSFRTELAKMQPSGLPALEKPFTTDALAEALRQAMAACE